MKISKLFHWLYAFLMFLPVTFLLPSLLYFGFNDNATAQEYTKEEPVYYQSNDVNSYDDLVVGNAYTLTIDMDTFPTNDLFILPVEKILSYYCSGVFEYRNDTLYDSSTPYIYPYGSSHQCITWLDVNNREGNYNLMGNVIFDFVYSQFISYDFLPYVSECDDLYIKSYQDVTYSMGITESINQSILDTFDLPMFSWTSDNFIIAPFNYITNLFGLPEGNVVNKYLDYWLSISIIYLCFDVIMYVPLLVHRWLDKGIVE